MASGAIKVELTNSTGFPRRYTCAAGTAISKGTLLSLSDPRTAIACNQAVANASGAAGIAAMDKSATDDTSTSISVWTDGIFEMVASGAIAIGRPVVFVANNCVAAANAAASGAIIAGYALETASDAETINVRIRL